jgi:hypothetical protein
MQLLQRSICVLTFSGFCLAFASEAYSQVYTINSVVLKPRVFNDIPGAVGTYIGTPTAVSFTELGVNSGTGFADRDVWYFSNNGTTPYQFQASDYFSASFNVTLVGNTSGIDLEAGWLFSNPSGGFGGDLQSIVTQSGVVAQFGGPSYYPFSPAAGGYPGAGGSVPNYTPGSTYNLGLIYTIDPNTGMNAFEYSVNGQYAASSAGDPYFDLINGAAVGSPGDFLGGYFQIQRSTGPNLNDGSVIFGNITIAAVPEPSLLALLGLGVLPMARMLRRRV